MAEEIVLPAWMEGVDLTRIGFPLAVDRSRYTKQTAMTYKETAIGPLQLDAYLPVGVEHAPAVLMIHGGGWRHGGRFQMGLSKWAGFLASAGLAVFSIDYRLAPTTTYPHSFQDCVDAFDWILTRAGDFGIAADRIGLWGDSAGGHFSLLLATAHTNPDFPGPRPQTPARIGAVVALYPPTNLLRLYRGERRSGGTTVINFVGVAPEENPELWREVSPIEYAHRDLPPLLILQGTRDLLVPHKHTIDYCQRLREIGANHELHLLENGLHGFDRLSPKDEAIGLIERTREFLVHNLR